MIFYLFILSSEEFSEIVSSLSNDTIISNLYIFLSFS
jgi:hypothetical protein